MPSCYLALPTALSSPSFFLITLPPFSSIHHLKPLASMARNRTGSSKRNNKDTGISRHRQEIASTNEQNDHEPSTSMMMCQSVAPAVDNPLKGLQLRMWDFAQCDPKRCTGARLERRGIFRGMPLKQPYKGIVLSPNGSVSVSPADRPILQELVSGLSRS